jgi:hypothetical protein
VEYVKETKANPIKKHVFRGKDGTSDFEQREKPLTMVGFENWLCDNVDGINYPDISDYFEGKIESYNSYLPISSRIRSVIKEDHTIGGMTMIYSQSITARLNGWAEKTDNTNKNTDLVINIDEDEAPKHILDQYED